MAITKVTRNLLSTGIDDQSNATAITIDSSENVGIGTTSPSAPLDVVTNSTVYAAKFTQSNTSNGDGVLVIVGSTAAADYALSVRSDAGNTSVLAAKADGKVGIGTFSPANKLEISGGNIRLINQADGRITFNNGATEAFFGFNGAGTSVLDAGSLPLQIKTQGSNYIKLDTNNTERMRIDASGNLLVGTTSTPNGTSSYGSGFIPASDARTQLHMATNSTSNLFHVRFYNPNGAVGDIRTSGTATSYNTSSDYRLKENVVTDWDATTRLKQLKPSRFNFIADADTTVDGFLAHEVQDIVPEAISGVKDEMQEEEYEVTPAVLDEDGNIVTEAVMGTREVPKYQGIDQSKLVPLLVKTIQELEERITTLENA